VGAVVDRLDTARARELWDGRVHLHREAGKLTGAPLPIRLGPLPFQRRPGWRMRSAMEAGLACTLTISAGSPL
jgi:hypothetical protein